MTLSSLFFFAALACIVAVLLTLFGGLGVMAAGNKPKTSNKLMQLRVILQGLAVLFLVLAGMLR